MKKPIIEVSFSYNAARKNIDLIGRMLSENIEIQVYSEKSGEWCDIEGGYELQLSDLLIDKFRIKPEPKKIPLSQEDIPFPCQLMDTDGTVLIVTLVIEHGVFSVAYNLNTEHKFYQSYKALLEDGWKYRMSSNTSWELCSKEEK